VGLCAPRRSPRAQSRAIHLPSGRPRGPPRRYCQPMCPCFSFPRRPPMAGPARVPSRRRPEAVVLMVTLGAEWRSRVWGDPQVVEEAPYLRRKRLMDIALASIALVALLPVFLVVAIAVLIDSRGPVLYAQERVGMDRRRERGPTPIRGNRRK